MLFWSNFYIIILGFIIVDNYGKYILKSFIFQFASITNINFTSQITWLENLVV